jgi:hypothetical protein
MEGIEVAAMRKLDIRNQKPLNYSKRYRTRYRPLNDKTFPQDSMYPGDQISAYWIFRGCRNQAYPLIVGFTAILLISTRIEWDYRR